ncbi:MAG TPA: hypothetical protein VKU83_11540 [Puia sp.]|nr:hypothetical protein [Puia sp.]
MSVKVPGFIFYPGDYLQDTQNLSADAQTAYDRIMCLHMKNICISKQQLDFFTKRLTAEQKSELLMVLVVNGEGEESTYRIAWVTDSILKYRKFCESRSSNRKGKNKEQVKNTSSTSEQLVENESVNEDEIENEFKEGGEGEGSQTGYANDRLLVPQMLQKWKEALPNYPDDPILDGKALYSIAIFLCKRGNLRGAPELNVEPILEAWEQLCAFISEDRFYKQKSLKTISNGIQEILQKALHGDQSKTTPVDGKGSGKFNDDKLKAGIRARVAERERAQGQTGTG